jgi:hypothetical protein
MVFEALENLLGDPENSEFSKGDRRCPVFDWSNNANRSALMQLW